MTTPEMEIRDSISYIDSNGRYVEEFGLSLVDKLVSHVSHKCEAFCSFCYYEACDWCDKGFPKENQWYPPSPPAELLDAAEAVLSEKGVFSVWNLYKKPVDSNMVNAMMKS
jgi:hypothetical protein